MCNSSECLVFILITEVCRQTVTVILRANGYSSNDFVKPEDQRKLVCFGLVRTDDKPRGEAEFTQTIPRREGRRRSQIALLRTNTPAQDNNRKIDSNPIEMFYKNNSTSM